MNFEKNVLGEGVSNSLMIASLTIEMEGFFSEGGQTRPPRMFKVVFTGGKVGDRGVSRG